LAGASNPFNVAESARLTSLSLTGGEVRLRFRGVVGSTYRLERSATLSTANWQTVSQLRIDSPSEVEIRDNAPLGTTRFYRTVLVP
jgi:hypothetical protein